VNVQEARNAIEAILAAIPDDELPEFDRVETEADGKVCVWSGGSGRILGSALRGGKRDPLIYRRNASWDAIQLEMAHRADRRLLDNGDDPAGIALGRKRVGV
jgi:hypothetical protein